MGEDLKPRRGLRTRTEETNSLLLSAIDMDQVIVAETDLLEESLDHGGQFTPQLDKIRSRAVRNAELLEILNERLRIITS